MSGDGDAAGGDSDISRREVNPVVSASAPAAVPDAVVSAATAPDPAQVAPPDVASKHHANGGKKRRRKINYAKGATAAKKKPKASSKRGLPTNVNKAPSGKFQSRMKWGGKQHYIGTFDTPEQAFAAYMFARKDLEHVNLSAIGADGVNAAFDAAQKKAVVAVGGFVPKKKKSKATSGRDLPTGVSKTVSGKFGASIMWVKYRRIGTFDTIEQASAAYMSMKKDLADARQSAVSADEVDAAFYAAQKKAAMAAGASRKKKPKAFEQDLPRGVSKTVSGKFVARTKWGGKKRQIGTFDTPYQASAAYMAVREDLDNAKLSAVGADDAVFAAAKKKALGTVQTMMDSDE